jgi:glycosyltransferase involved in cell wall biosynthesis
MAGADLLQFVFGGIGGHVAVASNLSRVLRADGLRSDLLLYATAGDLVAREQVAADFDDVRSIVRARRPDVEVASHVVREVTRSRPRVVVCHTHYALAAIARLRLRGICAAAVLVEHQYISGRGWAQNLRSLQGALLLDAVVFLSVDYKDRYPLRRLPTPALRRSRVIPNGIAVPSAPPTRPVATSAPVVVIAVGRLIPGKGFEDVLRAAAAARRDHPEQPMVVRIAGDGPDLGRLQQLAAELHLQGVVEFRGALPASAIPAFLRDGDIYVHPSRGETMSVALLEAYAAGLAVVAADVEGINNFARAGEDALLFPSGDVAAMTLHLVRLAASPAERLRLGAEAFARVRTSHSALQMAAGYKDLFAELDPGGPWKAK